MFLADPPPAADAQRLFDADIEDGGYVTNFTRLWAWRPDLAVDFWTLRRNLMARCKLSRRELVIAACACVARLGDSYCALSFGSVLSGLAGPATAASLLGGDAPQGLAAREHAIADWARKVAGDPNATTRDDVDRLRAAGLDDKDIFELTTFVAFRIAFATVNDALGALPDWQMAEAAPAAVRAAVQYGRPAAPLPTAESPA